jgi:hypothetical protein
MCLSVSAATSERRSPQPRRTANIARFANAYLFRNLPFADSERVLYVSSVNGKTGRGRGVSYPYRDLAANARSFESVGAKRQVSIRPLTPISR